MRRLSRFLLLGCAAKLYEFAAVAWTPNAVKSVSIVHEKTISLMERPSRSCGGGCGELGWIRKDSARIFQTNIASLLLYGFIMLAPVYPASAGEIRQVMQPAYTSLPASSTSAEHRDALENRLRAISFILSEDTEPLKGRALRAAAGRQQIEQYPALEEVWTLIDKYYIDRTFGGQYDWKKVREKYRNQVSQATSEEAKFGLVSEMVGTLNDKYSRTLDRAQYAAIQKYDLIGVGVTLMPDADKNIIVGAPPIPGSEAARVGMQEGDYVVAINGISTTGRTAFDIIDQISQDPSAKSITMTIRPKGSDPESTGKVLTMARMFEEVRNPIRYKISETRPDGTKVGFVKILEFNALVKGNLANALAELEAEGANAYVLDIRQNRGGAFQSAVEISSLFTENRIATYVVDSTKDKLPFRTAKGQLAVDATDPMVIWIDGKSASASEVLAGSLHDNCRAVLMGETSFGKGLIQAVYGLKNGAGLVLTVARYVTPSGNDIQGVGIKPDLGTKDLPFGLLGLGTDTSKIDFVDIRNRLSQCRIPDEIR
jgi:carboxyl-terminal processing protease